MQNHSWKNNVNDIPNSIYNANTLPDIWQFIKKRKKKEYHQCIKAVVLRLTSEFAFFRHIIRNSPQPDAESVYKPDLTSFDIDGKSWFLYSNLANSCVSLFDILRENSY